MVFELGTEVRGTENGGDSRYRKVFEDEDGASSEKRGMSKT